MTGFWRRIFGGQAKPAQESHRPAQPTRHMSSKSIQQLNAAPSLSLEAQAEILSQFRNGADPERVPPEAWRDFWAHKLGMSFRQAARALFLEGLLCEGRPEAKLSALHTLSELKARARKMGLKVSGRKDELATRLVDNADPELLAELSKTSIWVCSDVAQETVRAHRENKKANLRAARLEALDLLRQKKLKEACESVGEYEQAQFFQRGLGVDWTATNEATYQRLKTVYAARPKFHERRLGEVPAELRERAAMSVLWGTSQFGDIFEKDLDKEQAELFSRMLEFHAGYVRNMKQFEELEAQGIKLQCQIIGTGDQNTTCPACLNDNGKLYRLQDAPELPHEHCECLIGCRCSIVAKVLDDF